MFKGIAATIFLTIFNLMAYSQDDTPGKTENKLKFGVNVSAMPDLSFEFKNGVHLSTQFIASKNKISILFGPVWWVYKNKDTNKFKGGSISLRYFPQKMSRTLNFYFMYDLDYFLQTNEWSRYMQYTPSVSYNVDFKSKIQTLRNQVGYGFILKLYKGLFFTQSLSFGMDCYNYNSTTTVIENPSLSENYSSGNIFSNTHASSTLKAGIEFHFK